MSDTVAAAVQVLAKFRSVLIAHPRILWSASTLAALCLVLRFVVARRSRRGKYIADLSQVGSNTDGTAWQAYDYDVIIVGGGTGSGLPVCM